ncbi:universal stress protein [Kitasatospora cinereorecta]|uniref:Universal stress protein n=1 Tax=Kitasatospora cinereorecta TaxID=285560 RepID=A0ABW0VDI8_9ACTN
MSEQSRVLVGVTDTLSSLAALCRAVEEARIRGAVLVPVTAWSSEEALRPTSELERAAHGRLDTAFEQAFGGCPDDLVIRPLVVRDAPGPALVRAARRPDDLLVLGCGHRGRRQHARVSATVRYCRAHAGCPVLVVSPTELLDSLELAVRTGSQSAAARWIRPVATAR